MRPPSFRFALILLSSWIVLGCAESQPAKPVVELGDDDAITRSELDRWVRAKAPIDPALGAPLRPPRFTFCTAAMRKAEGAGSMPIAKARQECREKLKAELGELIEWRWLKLEAHRLGLRLDEHAVREAAMGEYQRYTPVTATDKPSDATRRLQRAVLRLLIRQGRILQLRRRVRTKLEAQDGAVTERDIERFYQRHAQRFAVPASRRIRVLQVSTNARAKAGARALRTGRRAFARRILFNSVPTSSEGEITVVENDGDEMLLRAVFSTPVGRVGGPVSDSLGKYVFVVDAARLRVQTFAKARRAIQRLLRLQRTTRIRQRYVLRYRSKTVCEGGYTSEHCASDGEGSR